MGQHRAYFNKDQKLFFPLPRYVSVRVSTDIFSPTLTNNGTCTDSWDSDCELTVQLMLLHASADIMTHSQITPTMADCNSVAVVQLHHLWGGLK